MLLVTRPCLAACHARYSAVYVCRQSQRPAWACACYQSFIERMEDRIAAHADACGPVEGSARDTAASHGTSAWGFPLVRAKRTASARNSGG